MGNEDRAFEKDLATYRRMSEPFPDAAAANAAIQAFNRELRELRAKHHMRDVVCIVGGSYLIEDESEPEGDFLIDLGHGDAFKWESMLAWAFGRAQKERQERINRFLPAVIEQPRKGK